MSNILISTKIDQGKLPQEKSQAIREYLAINDGTEVVISLMQKGTIANALDVMPVATIGETLKAVEQLVNLAIPADDANTCIKLASNITAWGVDLARCQASAKYYAALSEAQAIETMPEGVAKLSPTERRKWQQNISAEAVALYELAERVNAAANLRVKLLISAVSLQKSLHANDSWTQNNQPKNADSHFPKSEREFN